MNILIISPYYPPHSSVAVVRMASLSRYLVKKGCNVTILRNKIEKADKQNQMTTIPKDVKIIDVMVPNYSSYMKTFWNGCKAYKHKLEKITLKKRFDIAIISGGPFYTLPLCKILKEKYSTKCILDFRDLWVSGTYGGKDLLNYKKLISKILFYPIERTSIKYADKVITVTEGWMKRMMKFYPRYKNKMRVIYNGYDDSLLKDIYEKENDEENIVLGIFGKLSYYSQAYSRELFMGINSLEDKFKKIKIMQVGILEEETRSIISQLKFPSDRFYCTGFRDYPNGIKMMQRARICILVDVRRAGLGTKIYDYIYLNKPVIYIGKTNTDLANFVSSFKNGFVCENHKQIAEKIEYILNNNIMHLSKENEAKQFSRSIQNDKYFTMIKELLSS